MNKVKVYRILTLILLLMLIATLTLAQNKIPVSVISSGGEKSFSTSFILGNTIGEPFIGKTVSSANQHNIGFWYVYKQSTTTEVKKEEEAIPTVFKLKQNYPNPFNPSTVIGYQLPVSGDVTLKVYDVLGREVATLVDNYKSAGRYEVEFSTEKLASGIYFYQLKVGSFIQVK